MPKVEIGGVTLDTLNRDELEQALAEAMANQYERLKGRDTVRFISPTVIPASSAVLVPNPSASIPGYPLGPEQGFVWSVRLLVVEGLTASSSTPDIVNVKRHGSGRIVWQLNGNQFSQTFGRGEMILYPGESLYLVNLGSISATGGVMFHGCADQVPFSRKGDLI